ncbi:MAG: Crp/Fnr family transcriptional regulator [Deltaproteobacteria bacterium]|nr:Crp/Fnr family transcriptional regulator [Candidatus Zymogenaceae bacterium]
MSAEDILLKKYGRDFTKGTILFEEGDSSSKEMYVIHAGKVKISKKLGDQETILAHFGKGEFFGEMAILNNKPRSATAEVVEDSTLLVIDPKTFEDMVKSNSDVSFRMIKKLADRLDETDKKIELLMIKDGNSRVIHTLERLCESDGRKQNGEISIPLTIEGLSSKAGVRMQMVQDIVGKLERAKIVSVSPDTFTVLNTERLKQYFEFLILKEEFGDLG